MTCPANYPSYQILRGHDFHPARSHLTDESVDLKLGALEVGGDLSSAASETIYASTLYNTLDDCKHFDRINPCNLAKGLLCNTMITSA
jgi:hypothetical protein